MAKARAARAFIVSLDVRAAPSICDRYAIRRLTVRRLAGEPDRLARAGPGRRPRPLSEGRPGPALKPRRP